VLIADLLPGFDLTEIGPNRFAAPNMDYYRLMAGKPGSGSDAVTDIITGGQFLSQAIMATKRLHPQKEVKSLHMIFARGGRVSVPTEIEVDPVQSGSTFSSLAVNFIQNEKKVAASLVLAHAIEGDLVRHESPPPEVETPKGGKLKLSSIGPFEYGYPVGPGGVDVLAPESVGLPELPLWVRVPSAPKDPAVHQGLLAFMSVFQIIGTSLRPHAGLSASMAHTKISTGPMAHSCSFHEPVDISDWILLHHQAPYAGRGRIYGRSDAYTSGGKLIASFTQDSMVRPLAHGAGRSGGTF
jgi:acyl-CoA thioesterase